MKLALSRSFLGLLFALTPLMAQTATGSISGAVRDPSGAAIAGAQVKLVNTATNETRTTASSGLGYYSFPLLAPAIYRLDIEQAGFKHFVRDEIKLDVGLNATIDVGLQLGQSTEVVNVT